MSNWLDKAVLAIAPETGLKRIRARNAAAVFQNYDAAGVGRRSKSWRHSSTDADAASQRRDRLAFVSRDMVRNTPLAARGRDVIVNNTIGDGIVPSLEGVRDGVKERFNEMVRAHCDSTDIDARGRLNLYGLQRLVLSTVVESGEALIRIRRRNDRNLALPFQLEVLEPDYLDSSRDSITTRQTDKTVDGIEYDDRNRRTAYWLYNEHPGGTRNFEAFKSRRVDASEIMHVYRQDRPEQMRGVSWFAPVAMTMQDLRDYFDAQLMRQKIAACFAAFRISGDDSNNAASVIPSSLQPGAIYNLGPGEMMEFATPPRAENDSFVGDALREIAMGLGITYESFFGDLRDVNYSSGRMGRMEMDRNVSSWQWLMMIPEMCDPIGRLILDTWKMREPTRDLRKAWVSWTPPARIIVDPAKEVPAMKEKVLAGFSSWSQQVRSLGHDPEVVAKQIAEDNATFDRLGLSLTSDNRKAAGNSPEEANGTNSGN